MISESRPSLLLERLTKRFPGGGGFGPIDLLLKAGESVVLLGPSGSGKSTLLRTIAGLETAERGTIRLGEISLDRLAPDRRGIGLLSQRPVLYPELTVAEHLAVAVPHAGPTAVSLGDTVRLLRLEALTNRKPHELSGGEKQRVALAKLLVRNAPVWLLDEPFASLDPIFRGEFRADLHLLREVSKATMLLVTHDPTDAYAFGHRVGVLENGLLQSLGSPEELRAEPRHPFTAFCFGWNLIPGRVRGGERSDSNQDFVSDCGSVLVALPEPVSAEATRRGVYSLTLGIRPEDIRAFPPESASPPPRGGRLSGWSALFSEPVGSGWFLTVARGQTRLRVEVRSESPPPVSEPTDWYIPTDACRWFFAPASNRVSAVA